MNDKMNNFIAKAYDSTMKGAKSIYNKTNKAFESTRTEDEDTGKNTSKGSGVFD